MGNCNSRKTHKEPDKFFERERWKEQVREEQRKLKVKQAKRREGKNEPPVTPAVLAAPPGPCPPPTPQHVSSYDDEALNRMRYQLHNDSEAFLLNNILLSVQFFENYEREVHQIKNNPISEREHLINEAMVRQNKHVFFADRLQECVHEHVSYQRSRGQAEPLLAPRLFVIYDNVEPSEPGDTSDYSAVLDAPFYKLRIEDGKESGYVKLRKMEVLESTLNKENEMITMNKSDSDDSIYTDSEKESNDSDEYPYNASKGEELLKQIKSKLETHDASVTTDTKIFTHDTNVAVSRRYSGPIKQVSLQVTKNSISNINRLKKINGLPEEEDSSETNINGITDKTTSYDESYTAPRKSILKNNRRLSGPTRDLKKYPSIDMRQAYSESNLAEDTETSGYRSNSSSRQAECSETESDYGYSTITEAATPKKIELSLKSNYSLTSGALPDETWTPVDIRALGDWSDEDDDDEIAESASKSSIPATLFERCYYLNSFRFMNNFVDNFIINLGSGLGLTPEEVNTALTQGASIYCDSFKNGSKSGYEIFPALVATWPNAANQWIIRERRIIQNPRTNFTYQWPTKYMVSKAIGFGCLLVPVGFRPKRGQNPDQTLQWKLIFPAAERYLESCLAHSHIRCYLFTLALHKTFIENDKAKIGVDASHIKNHLFWQCEDNYAKWPEDRLGESLRLFLTSLYGHFMKTRMPNYFVESCNEFLSIPTPLLHAQQRSLADILESPVMHVLHALDKIKYTKRDFYPSFNCKRLYDILTCKNPLRMINPNLPPVVSHYQDSSDSEDDTQINFWDKAKAQDKNYQWQKERQRQLLERRKVQVSTKKQRPVKQEREISRKFIIPPRMETERRRLVFEFFIPHFIAMARSSEKFEAIRQAVIYLEQAQRLCTLLLEEPGGDMTANEYLEVIREKLSDCQRKLVNQGGYKLPPRRESKTVRTAHKPLRKQRPKFEEVQDSPTDNPGISAFTFVDVHADNSSSHSHMKLNEFVNGEESKL
ncbi:uncharacterized protein LOC110369988 [Helicoverpa armigera]|uniref:uncharacterized protein LOC110369988 n=1 Tax=Helicoverpa armigera TaxID=29058 RepID=UPI003083664E